MLASPPPVARTTLLVKLAAIYVSRIGWGSVTNYHLKVGISQRWQGLSLVWVFSNPLFTICYSVASEHHAKLEVRDCNW